MLAITVAFTFRAAMTSNVEGRTLRVEPVNNGAWECLAAMTTLG